MENIPKPPGTSGDSDAGVVNDGDAGSKPDVETPVDLKLPADHAEPDQKLEIDTTPPAPPDAAIEKAPDNTDPAQYNFEDSAQGWATLRTSPSQATADRSVQVAFRGKSSLKITFNAARSEDAVFVGLDQGKAPADLSPGTSIFFHVWTSGDNLHSVQPFMQEKASPFRWTGAWTAADKLSAKDWTTITLVVPANAGTVDKLGVEIKSAKAGVSTIYVDTVSW